MLGPALVIEQEAEPRARVEPEVVLALGTDLPVSLQVFFPDDLATTFALGPQALGANVRAFAGLQFLFFFFEPGHGKVSDE
jgi:hypothetical protein